MILEIVEIMDDLGVGSRQAYVGVVPSIVPLSVPSCRNIQGMRH
jgi:hypothetical protein